MAGGCASATGQRLRRVAVPAAACRPARACTRLPRHAAGRCTGDIGRTRLGVLCPAAWRPGPAGWRSAVRTACGRCAIPARALAAGAGTAAAGRTAAGRFPEGRACAAGLCVSGCSGGAGTARARTEPPEGGAGAQPAGTHPPGAVSGRAAGTPGRRSVGGDLRGAVAGGAGPGTGLAGGGDAGTAAAQARRRVVVASAGGFRAAQCRCRRGRARRAGAAGLGQGPRRASPRGRGHRRGLGTVLQPHRCAAAPGAACHRQHVAPGHPHPRHPEGSADVCRRTAGAAAPHAGSLRYATVGGAAAHPRAGTGAARLLRRCRGLVGRAG